jgi:hypothetical protein
MLADEMATAGHHPAGATDVHLTTGRMQEHQIPEATIRPDGRGAMVVFVAHLNMPGEVQHVHHEDACGAGFLPPAPATGGFTLPGSGPGPWRRLTEVPMPRDLPSDTPWRPMTLDCGNQDPPGGTRTWNHENPASLAGRLARSPGTTGWRAGTTQGRERAPPKRCHRGQHPAQDVQAEGTAAGMLTVSSDKLRLSCTVTIWFGALTGASALAALFLAILRAG